jgi:hypothetical protein
MDEGWNDVGDGGTGCIRREIDTGWIEGVPCGLEGWNGLDLSRFRTKGPP